MGLEPKPILLILWAVWYAGIPPQRPRFGKLRTSLGSTSLVTDENGNQVTRLEYTPYGSLLDQTGPPPTDRLYTGQRFETGLQLYDYRARMYDPLTANFIQPDLIVPEPGHPRGWNRYGYVYGNPVRYSDPSGHCVVGYSGDVRMSQYPSGTSGICPNTEHWIIESHSMHMCDTDRPPTVDGASLFVSTDTGTPIKGVGGFEVLVNNHTGDVAVFGVYGPAVNIGAKLTANAQINFVNSIGKDNRNYGGVFVFVNVAAADVIGANLGAAYTPLRDKTNFGEYIRPNLKSAYSVGAGPVAGVGGALTVGVLEYVPLFTLTSEGAFRPDAGWYIVENDAEDLLPFFIEAVEVLAPQAGYNPDDYNFSGLGRRHYE